MLYICVSQILLRMNMTAPIKSKNRDEISLPEDLPGDLIIWLFIFAELMVFALFFISYIVTRSNNIELFNQYQLTLDVRLGLLNTIVLLTSSFFVVKSVHAATRDDQNKTVFWLFAAVLTGLVFVVVKSYEFSYMYSQGVNLSTNTFYMFYLSMTFFTTCM